MAISVAVTLIPLVCVLVGRLNSINIALNTRILPILLVLRVLRGAFFLFPQFSMRRKPYTFTLHGWIVLSFMYTHASHPKFSTKPLTYYYVFK